MKRIFENPTILAIFVVLFSFLGWLGVNFALSRYEVDTPGKIKVGVSNTYKENSWFLKVAEEQGYFSKYNLQVEEVTVGSNTGALLSSGEADVVINRAGSVLGQYLNDEDSVLIDVLQNYNSVDYFVSKYPKSDFKKIKTIGVSRRGGANHVVLDQVLAGFGLNQKYEVIVAGESSTAKLASFESGKIDAILLDKKDVDNLDAKKYTVITPEEAFSGIYSPFGIYSTKEIIGKKESDFERFVKAMHEAGAYVESHREESIDSLAKYLEVDKNVAETTYGNIINSRKNLLNPPKVNDLKSVEEAVIRVTDPSNPNKELSGFIFTEFTLKAQR